MKNFDGLTQCARECMEGKACKVRDCRMWVEYKDDKNCTLIAIYNLSLIHI